MKGEDGADEEEKLVLLAIGGYDRAFEQLVARKQAWLRSLLRRISADAALADDVAQDAFIRAWRRIGSLKDHRAFEPWLRRIALRVWLDVVRARKLRLEDDLVAPTDFSEGGADAADHRLDLAAALNQLRPGPRACVILFYAEGMSHTEVSEATGLSIGVVKSHIARSTPRLRRFLHEWRST